MRYGSDVVVEFLAAAGIEYVALNPGASFRGLHDSLDEAGTPQPVVALHEEVAIGIAHGYAKSAGKPMAVFVHDQVGLHHAAMALFNAWVDAVPMLVIGGSGPRDVTRRRPWIDWIHSGHPESAVIRDIVKWDAEPAALEAIPETLARALRIATTPPYGPVYVAIDALLQEAEAGDLPSGGPVAPAPPITAPRAVVDELAQALTAAERPAFVVDRGAPGASVPLLSLAAKLSAAVVDLGGRSFPAEHWADQTTAALADADLVVALELRDVTWGLTTVNLEDRSTTPVTAPGARVVAVGLAEQRGRGFLEPEAFAPGFERITAELTVFLGELDEAVAMQDRPDRRAALTAAHDATRAAAARAAADAAGEHPIAPAHLAASLARALADTDFQLANGLLGGWPRKLLPLRDESTYLGRSGGEGLGYGLPASLGAALAQKDGEKLVVDIQADGDLMYVPEALWTAAHHELPLLIVVHNNRTYGKDELHQAEIAKLRGRPGAPPPRGIRLQRPEIDFAGLARAQGVDAVGPIEDPQDLEKALQDAVHRLTVQQRPLLIDVVCRGS
ncbi:thiamine pyrophosphate-binding protein [Solirubrobacter sp. CPCC 204708]|uniref:Thiamine pyrophosphate-binding protein n=1 Tax=Solirubrobacter deserti TaxID=2282478 RepID=A0ABT4RFB5_9ACTN|nr:thiamine pyrophosphate-binding protein [Solirubrobacter deserti]MBE2319491.1 thiamine pyrophosphate-binding protein [Solirubrobacter deserti]MDA0137222.1 thiamine pyrophosphate-binding protein [Solirubrobacter deserti]